MIFLRWVDSFFYFTFQSFLHGHLSAHQSDRNQLDLLQRGRLCPHVSGPWWQVDDVLPHESAGRQMERGVSVVSCRKTNGNTRHESVHGQAESHAESSACARRGHHYILLRTERRRAKCNELRSQFAQSHALRALSFVLQIGQAAFD